MSPDPRDPELQVEPGPDWLTLRDVADELGLPDPGPLEPAWAKLEAAAAAGRRPCLGSDPVAWAWVRSRSDPVFAITRTSVDTVRAGLGMKGRRADPRSRPPAAESGKDPVT